MKYTPFQVEPFGEKRKALSSAECDFNNMAEWEKKYPGFITYSCEFCGIYTASRPRCNKCEAN